SEVTGQLNFFLIINIEKNGSNQKLLHISRRDIVFTREKINFPIHFDRTGVRLDFIAENIQEACFPATVGADKSQHFTFGELKAQPAQSCDSSFIKVLPDF